MLGVPGLSCQAPKQTYAGGPVSLYYSAVTEPHLAACDENIAGFHHLNPVGIGRVVLSPFVFPFFPLFFFFLFFFLFCFLFCFPSFFLFFFFLFFHF